jgi:hypothetical protein
MKNISEENLIIRKIIEHDYNGDSLVLGNVSKDIMDKLPKILPKVDQNIALIDILNIETVIEKNSNTESIIFEYFWGTIYQYIYNNPELREKYITSDIKEKLNFFYELLQYPLKYDYIKENGLLFSWEPRIIISERGNSDFKICISNYQEITSLYLARYINLLTRERPQISILTTEQGLKCNITEGDWVTQIGHDFHYFDVKKHSSEGFRIEKLKIKQ